jgi:hypothetical protein
MASSNRLIGGRSFDDRSTWLTLVAGAWILSAQSVLAASASVL